MDIPNMLNAPFARPGRITAEGVSALDSDRTMSGDEGRQRSPRPLPTSPWEESPTRATINAEPVSCNNKCIQACSSIQFCSHGLGQKLSVAIPNAPMDIPRQVSPSHKYSNSDSSFSSFMTRSTPQSHSRFPSISTIGDGHTMSPSPKASPLDLPKSDFLGSIAPHPQLLSRDEMSLHSVSPVAELPPVRTESSPFQYHGRFRSPSDAIIRTKAPKLGGESSAHDSPSSKEHVLDLPRLLAPPDTDSIKAHRRTLSAPGPHSTNSSHQPTYNPRSPSRPLSPLSQFRQKERNTLPGSLDTMNPTKPLSPIRFRPNECMFMERCDTGAPLRKAISHILGRNKLCTRAIPIDCWVQICRKHYQRGRYRNLQDFALFQCALLQIQIQVIEEWSDKDKTNAPVGTVQDWTLTMRKREQHRMQEKSRKRPYSDRSDNEEDDNNVDHAVLTGTAVPDWLRKECRSGYSTEEITKIVGRIRNEVEDGKLNQIPDIEILPNISTEGVEVARAKKTQGRRNAVSSATDHKRTRSLSATGHTEPNSPLRSGQTMYSPILGTPGPVIENYPRMMAIRPHHEHSGYTYPRESSITPSDMRPTVSQPYRSIFSQIPQIRESDTEEQAYGNESVRDSHLDYIRGPLPAPAHPALANPQLEPSASGCGRYGHQRSASEYVDHSPNMRFGFQTNEQSPRVPFTTTYPDPTYASTGPSSTSNCRPIPNQSLYPCDVPRYPQSGPHRRQNVDRLRHSRHQSTPTLTPPAFPYSQDYFPNSDYSYGEPRHLREHSSFFHSPPQYRPEQPRQYPLHAEFQDFGQTTSHSNERR
ncbi:hypothetical protein F5Y03DRAFT_216257 [Xylaria venustula]|nr:hypothetical protein F5Y03DRAFT_216257 [Xylaria venustula]